MPTIFANTKVRHLPWYSRVSENINFKTKNLCEWQPPFNHLNSDSCALWHILINTTWLITCTLYNVCKQCKLVYRKIQQLEKIAHEVSPTKKLNASYRCPLTYLSLSSIKKEVNNLSVAKKKLVAKGAVWVCRLVIQAIDWGETGEAK